MFKFERDPHTDSQMRKLRQTTVKLALLIFFPSNGSKVGGKNCKKLSIIISTNWIINQYFFLFFSRHLTNIQYPPLILISTVKTRQCSRASDSVSLIIIPWSPERNDRKRASELMDERWPRTQTRECQRIPKLLEWKKNVKTMKNIYYTIIIFLREIFVKGNRNRPKIFLEILRSSILFSSFIDIATIHNSTAS